MHSLRISTLNVWAMPAITSTHVAERIPAIVQRVAEQSVDVAAFQEVWTPQARRLLVEQGQRVGLVPAWSADKSPGGLFVLTRVPVRRTGFTRYVLAGLPQRPQHADYYGRKGFAEVELETADGPLVLIVTHLHARYSDPGEYDEYLGMRAAQVAQLAAAIDAIKAPCVAVGDFNFREDGPEYHALTRLTGLVDAAADLDHRQPTSVAGNPYHGVGHTAEERIDYVFARSGVEVASVRRDFDQPVVFAGEPGAYSDHAGLLAEITVSAGSSQPTFAEPVAPDPVLRDPIPQDPILRDPASVGLLATLMERGRTEARKRKHNQRRWGVAVLVAAALGHRPLRGRATPIGVGVGAGLLLFAEWVARKEAAGYDEVEAMLRSGTIGR